MIPVRSLIAFILIITIGITPGWSATGAEFGTVIAADRARVGGGSGIISAGSTVFAGDKLFTDDTGSLQLRAGAARFLLSSDSIAILNKGEAIPAASLTRGTAIFSTAVSKAFALHVGGMVIRAETDQPTVAQVSVVGPRELTVSSTRGSVSVAVDDDVRVIAEGQAYRILLDPSEAEFAAADAAAASSASSTASPAAQGPEGAGSRGRSHGPLRAGRNRFIWYAIGVVAIVTILALWKALESPSHP